MNVTRTYGQPHFLIQDGNDLNHLFSEWCLSSEDGKLLTILLR